MPVRFVYSISLVVCFIVFHCGAAYARPLGILSPQSTLPANFAAGDAFEVEVAIPMALTPPPGVQKVAVWNQWHVYLARQADLVTGDVSGRLIYETRLLRIRPDRRNVNYVISAESVHWLPSGEYDLIVNGPGFRYVSQNAIHVSVRGNDGIPRCTNDMSLRGELLWQIRPAQEVETDCWIDLVVPGDFGAASVWVDNRRVPLSLAVWAAHFMHGASDDRRLLRIRVPPRDRARSLKIKAQKSNAQHVSIMGGESVRPMVWTKLRARASFAPIQVIWEFVDGDSRIGSEVQYRWMVGTTAVAKVTAFDEFGRPWTAELDASLIMPLSRNSDCSGNCAVMPAPVTRRPGIFHLFQFCIESFFNLME